MRRAELGWEFLDSEGKTIIRAHNIQTTGDFYVYVGSNVNKDFKVVLDEIFLAKDNLDVYVYHFKIKEKEDEG